MKGGDCWGPNGIIPHRGQWPGPLTKHSEDGRRGGAAGAGASLCHAVVRASISAGGCRQQKVAAGSLEK